MAITVLPREVGKYAPLGEALGGLATGFGKGLENLAQQKLNQIQSQNKRTGLAQFWLNRGLPANEAYAIADQPEAFQKSLLDRLEGVGLGGAQGQEGQGQGQGLVIGPNPAERRHRETLNQQREIATEKQNAPLIKEIREQAIPARKAVDTVSNLKRLVDTGKVKTGIQGRFTPNFLQTPEGQEFLAGINELVLLKAQLGKGVPTKLRLSLEQLSKPDVWQHPKTIKNLLNKIETDPETQRFINRGTALEEILEQTGETSPRNLESLINRRTKELLKARKPEQQQNTFSELPPAQQFDGKVATNPATGQKLQSVNGQWVPFKG